MKIILEGISGAGKSTQLRRLHRRLQSVLSVQIVEEFSHGAIGRAIEECFCGKGARFVRFHSSDLFAEQTQLILLADAVAKAEQMFYSQARVLLVDRLFDSWLCYALGAKARQGLEESLIRSIHRRFSSHHKPGDAVTVFLEIDVEMALERLANRDGFGVEQSDRESLEEIAQRFSELYTCESVLRVDASLVPEEVTAAIIQATGLGESACLK